MTGNCIVSLRAMGSRALVIALVLILVSEGVGGQAVKPPTKAPIKAPIKAPTRAPSKAPTRAPSKAPTRAPTVAPVKSPAGLPLPMAPAPAPGMEDLFPPCQGVLVVYESTFTKKIYPFLNDTLWIQPYMFQATATLTNMGYSTLENWAMGILFQHDEILVTAADAVLLDGQKFPVDVSNGTIITAKVPDDLKNAIETAGNLTFIQRVIKLTGTEFGVKTDPMPSSINITDKNYMCNIPTMKGNNTMYTCCLEKNRNITLTDDSENYLPSEIGNITILYDVTQAYEEYYTAQVSITNNMPVTRIDHWNLSWTWQQSEFINTIMGAQTYDSDVKVCVNGLAGRSYPLGPDVNKAACCSLSPVILDLPTDRTNDTNIGGIKNCCKNGTIYPAIIDPHKTKAAFLMTVYKVFPANTDMTYVIPPQGFKIGDGDNTTDGFYTCGKPRLIVPTVYPDPWDSLIHSTSAVKTWQVTCNITAGVVRTPKCCVSFSAYYNESVIPCRNGACGHPAKPPLLYGDAAPTCDADAGAMLLPYGALTLAPINRTKKITAWATLNHKHIPSPLPCTDYCAVNLNWHVVSDFKKGWSARLTLLDWSNITYPDWYSVMEMPIAAQGLQEGYSMNTTRLPLLNDSLGDPYLNNSFVITGMKMYNDYLEAAENFTSGKIQSVISFTKQPTPGIQVPLGDGFPSRVWFNGDECVMPEYQPTNASLRLSPSVLLALWLLFGIFMLGL